MTERLEIDDPKGTRHSSSAVEFGRSRERPTELVYFFALARGETGGFAQAASQVSEEVTNLRFMVCFNYFQAGIDKAAVKPAHPRRQQRQAS
jgi:hypothetical protein